MSAHTHGGRIGLARVHGDSMEPTLRRGERLVVRYGVPVRKGGLVLAHFADGTLAVKRATERRTTRTGAPGWWLLSDNPGHGIDSRHRGVVAEDAVVATVVLRLWPPALGRRL